MERGKTEDERKDRGRLTGWWEGEKEAVKRGEGVGAFQKKRENRYLGRGKRDAPCKSLWVHHLFSN